MKKLTLKKVFFLYSLVFLGLIFALCIALYIALMAGARHQVYYFANFDEKQVETLQQRIEKEQRFDPSWVPPSITYFAFNLNNEVLSSNGSSSDQKLAQAFLKGEDISYSKGYFVKSVYPGGTCVFKYQIGVRYSSEWANQHLPRVEVVLMSVFLFSILLSVALFVGFISKRLKKDLSPLKNTVRLIGEGNLNYPVPHLSIKEFEEIGALTERMRSDLKNTLQILWTNENQMQEATTQMLHDYRTPLTIARANAEFLRDDLSRMKNMNNKDNLIAYANSLIFNLERLAEVGDNLQQQMSSSNDPLTGNKTINFDEFNQSIDRVGYVLGEYYGDRWQSNFQKCQEVLSIDEMGFKQTLTNILINAFEHGASPQTVDLKFEVHNSELTYLIRNSGSHFSESALANGTKKEFSEKTKDKQVVMGFGLYFVKKFLDKYDGTIKLFNTPESHACVRISLPIKNTKAGS